MINVMEQLGILFLIVVTISFIVKVLRQPIIIGYVLSGLFFAHFLAKENNLNEIMLFFSELGIIFMLFLMGIDFDLKSLKHLGKDMLITTLIQSFFFFIMGIAVASLFSFTWMERIHLAVVLMFSSTLFVAKWVEDKKETGTLHGKVIFSTLIFQDIIAILVITFLSVIEEKSLVKIATAPLLGIALLVIAYITSRYILRFLLKIASKYAELLFIFSLSFCFFFVAVAGFFGYSATIGAFLGGIVLGNTLYKTDIYARLKPLTIFFNMLFFVGLGFQMQVSFEPSWLLLIALCTFVTLLVKPLIFYVTYRMRGYDIKTAFLSGISLAQNSEFGIVIVFASVTTGLVSQALGAVAIVVVILTMILSSYFIKYDKQIFAKLRKGLEKFDRFFITKQNPMSEDVTIDAHFIFLGYYEFGSDLMEKITASKKKMVVIENDVHYIDMLKKDNIPFLFNAVYSSEFFEHVHFKTPELIVSNKVDMVENKMILKEFKKINSKCVVILTARNVKESIELYNVGADYVIYPTYLNEKQIASLLEEYIVDQTKVQSKKVIDLAKFYKKAKEDFDFQTKNSLFQDIDEFIKDMTPSFNLNDFTKKK